MRYVSTFVTVLLLGACAGEFDTELQSGLSEMTVLYTAETDPQCTEQVWSLALNLAVDDTFVGGQLRLRGLDPVVDLEMDLMEHQQTGAQMSFEILSDADHSWHVEALEVLFTEVSEDRVSLDYVVTMLDGEKGRGSLSAPIIRHPGGCID